KGAIDRIPAYITRVVQDTETHDFCGQLWFSKTFEWTDQHFSAQEQYEQPLIYESHTGMAQEKEGLGTYQEFADEILPRIKNGGYNSVQLMAVMEHPYYGSFGYHVSNFFCASSRFGTPEDLKYLVNKAHSIGLAVIMDVVHSHAVKNVAEGLNEFDGTDQYFHGGPRGYHTAWDSKLFDYGKWEVKRFLLSNLKYWLDEYHFDGFRFDGVTSMLYFHHGFTTFDHYDKYFKFDVDWDAVTYMQLANELVHSMKSNVLSIAEDVSGMPGLCRTIEDGGVGYDYRLAMGIPDFWIKYLKERADEDWNIHEMWSTLTNRRFNEKTIAYAESHDQALVGDKTLAFWLMDQEMYYHMLVSDKNLVIDRGIALHKMIRLFTMSLGGEGYLNFMGNEFGHPEWIDFPRQGNNWSYKYARRQWTLVDSDQLKYKFLSNFDKGMLNVMKENKVLSSLHGKQLNMDDANKVIVYERNNLVFVFNFHVSNSIFGYKFQVPVAGTYSIILNSDDEAYGGFGRVDNSIDYHTDENGFLQVYLTNRTGLVLKRKSS
ncbi:MAG TPA: alpha amylase C-terminal domain-containing protein, partial [Cytophagaceae bacterium]